MIEYLVQYKGEVKSIFAPDPKTAAMLAGVREHPKYNPTSCLIKRGRITNVVTFRTDTGELVHVCEREARPHCIDLQEMKKNLQEERKDAKPMDDW